MGWVPPNLKKGLNLELFPTVVPEKPAKSSKNWICKKKKGFVKKGEVSQKAIFQGGNFSVFSGVEKKGSDPISGTTTGDVSQKKFKAQGSFLGGGRRKTGACNPISLRAGRGGGVVQLGSQPTF